MFVLTIPVPSNLFLNKIGKPALYLPAVMCVWGVISTCTAAVQSFGGLVAVRFVLGFVEAAYFRELRLSKLGSLIMLTIVKLAVYSSCLLGTHARSLRSAPLYSTPAP